MSGQVGTDRRTTTLQTKGVMFGYAHTPVLQDVSVTVPKGKISVILGANGCGKSTLLKTMARLLAPKEGAVLLDGKHLREIPLKQLARQLGILPQSPSAPGGIRVADLIMRGRFPYRTYFGGVTQEDTQAVSRAMELMGVTELADRSVDELSGGQRQRVWIALALAQQTDFLLLDEPTTYLDIAYQLEILERLDMLNKEKGTTIVMVLHDINFAARYADHLFVMKKGRLIREGAPGEVITPDLLRDVYDLECRVMEDPVSHAPMILPVGRRCVKPEPGASAESVRA